MSRRLGCLLLLVPANLLCLAVAWVGLRVGGAYDYTLSEWLSVLLPDFTEPGEIGRVLLMVTLVSVPAATLGILTSMVVERLRRR